MDATGRLTYRLPNRDTGAKARQRGPFTVMSRPDVSLLGDRVLKMWFFLTKKKKKAKKREGGAAKEPPGNHRQEGVLAHAGGPDLDQVSRALGQPAS